MLRKSLETLSTISLQVIILRVRDLLYHYKKTGYRMTLGDLKICLQKNLNLKVLQEALLRKGDSFDQTWNIFLTDPREDNNTKLVSCIKIAIFDL